MVETIDALGGETQMLFDARDNLLSVVDANNHAIETNLYDLRNRLIKRTDAHGRSESYQRDANGNITARTDRKGQVTTYQYDALDHVILSLALIGIAWSFKQQREKEQELLFIGNEIRTAIGRYYEKTPGTIKRYPSRLQDLLRDNRQLYTARYLRRIYLDPMTGTELGNRSLV